MKWLIPVVALVAIAGVAGYRAHGTSAAAFDFRFTENCDGAKADVTFRWQGLNPKAAQWVDVTRNNNGWQNGTYTGAGPLPAGAESYTWSGLTPQVTYLVRINHLVDGRWDVSPTFAFIPCAPLSAQRAALTRDTGNPNPPTAGSSGQPANCHPSYQGGADTATGGCIRTGASDYDCEGGGGDGPNYVKGPLRVIGPDVYGLDSNNNGIGCE